MLGNESTLTVHFRIDGPDLYRYQSRAIERFVPWGPRAGAWRLTDGAWVPYEPEIDVAIIEENARRSGIARFPRRCVAACQFLIERWPQEARDAVRSFPSAHWQLLQFVNAGGAPALELLRSNPALGYLAATVGAAGQVGLRRRSLASFCGFPETEHAVHLLRKVPTEWISTEFLAHLRAAMTGERAADAVLSHLARINPIALEVARDPELRGLVAPECLARLSWVAAPQPHCDLVARMRDLLAKTRSRALPLPRFRTLSDLDQPVIAAPVQAPPPIRAAPRLERPVFPAPPAPRPSTHRQLAFPEPPLSGLSVPGIRICAIASHAELIAEGNVMEHCAGNQKSYARRVAAGRLYFYRMLEPERLTIAIRPEVRGWVVEEMKGLRNREPHDFSQRIIVNWLQRCSESSSETTSVKHLLFARPALVQFRPVARPRRRTPTNQLSFDFDAACAQA